MATVRSMSRFSDPPKLGDKDSHRFSITHLYDADVSKVPVSVARSVSKIQLVQAGGFPWSQPTSLASSPAKESASSQCIEVRELMCRQHAALFHSFSSVCQSVCLQTRTWQGVSPGAIGSQPVVYLLIVYNLCRDVLCTSRMDGLACCIHGLGVFIPLCVFEYNTYYHTQNVFFEMEHETHDDYGTK